MVKTKNLGVYMWNVYFTADSFVVEGPDRPFDSLSDDDRISDDTLAWMKAFEADRHQALFYLGFQDTQAWFSPALTYLHHIADRLIRQISRQTDIELVRDAVQIDLSGEDLLRLKERLPFAVGTEYVDDAWLQALWKALLETARTAIREYDGTVAQYLAAQQSSLHVVGRVFFHLVENEEADYPFAFMATYSTKPVKSKRTVHTPLKNALVEFDGDEARLLSLIASVVRVAEQSVLIAELLKSGELFSPIRLTTEEAYTFLQESLLYEEAGILCRIPDWWRKKNHALHLSVKVGDREPSSVGLNAIMDFTPILQSGDDIMSEQDLMALMEMSEGLVRYKGKWVEINKKKLETALAAFDKVKNLTMHNTLSLGEAMRLELNTQKLLDLQDDDISISITNGQWLRTVKEKLVHPEMMDKTETVDTFHAVLRPYQAIGYHWLQQMCHLGFGACLADDMGLGKTVQLIAFLEFRRTHAGGQALLILPASLLGNWQKEIEKFAPEMPFQILHPSSTQSTEALQIQEGRFLYITSYGMAARLEALKSRRWDYLILDEAQAIKNPGTRQTKAVKAIPADMRIALTGTPIENRLGDLWSLFDFLNQGLLGSGKEFTAFIKNIQANLSGYTKLRKMIHPFILRRLKTDKNVISDLPDKMEMTTYTTLSRNQVVLYRRLLEDIAEKLEHAEGIERKGLVLSSIMKFKQICNHPDHYLGREIYKPEHSGKFEQLKEICETIYEKRERVLVFTQFREMTEPLSAFLSGIFQREGFVLHGGTPVKKRNEMVEKFNGEHYVPYMVLSLKAGGVGLNLTAANHVIHFDRWWNPAVESQATDRVFRIGQTKNVMVHAFVTKGTIEEKIGEMIERKRKLSGDVLGSEGEAWITEYSNEELLNVFALSGD